MCNLVSIIIANQKSFNQINHIQLSVRKITHKIIYFSVVYPLISYDQ